MKTKLTFTKNQISNLVLLFFCCSMQLGLNAQSIPRLQDPTNPFLQANAIEVDPPGGVIYFSANKLFPGQLFTTYKVSTGLGEDDAMMLEKSWTDSLLNDEDSDAPGLIHDLYQQYYKGILVEGAEYTEHRDADQVWATNGFVVEGLNRGVSPTLTEQQCLAIALDELDVESIAFNENNEQPNPVGKLLLALCGDRQIKAENYYLCWQFTIVASLPDLNETVYVDASTGEILKRLNNICTGSFNHFLYGTQYDLDTRYRGGLWNDFYLNANDNGKNILTKDGITLNTSDYRMADWKWTAMPKSSGDDHWGNDNWAGTASHYCAQIAWDYFKASPLNRNGMDGNGFQLRVVGDYAGGQFTPFNNRAVYINTYGYDYILVGRYNNILQATYDIIGHEFTHGINLKAKDMVREKESGALNESFGDIFGFMIERYKLGYIKDWTIGEDVGQPIRSLANPSSTSVSEQGPSFYNGPLWITPNCTPSLSNDYCGMHTNASVGNKWFHLLSTGGGQSINGQLRSVSAIGVDKSARIAFYNLVNNVSKYETYAAARSNAGLAARILYGFCSKEYNSTMDAWHAVNVGPQHIPCAIAQYPWFRNQSFSYGKTGISEEEKAPRIMMYPNPANEKITLYAELVNNLEKDLFTIELSDVNGNIIRQLSADNLNHIDIPLNEVSNGVYFVTIRSTNWVKMLKFVKL